MVGTVVFGGTVFGAGVLLLSGGGFVAVPIVVGRVVVAVRVVVSV